MSKPIEDPPSLVEALIREHAARRECIEVDADSLKRRHVERCVVDPAGDLARVHAERCASFETLAGLDDTLVDDQVIASRGSAPALSVVVDQCAERRAALDDEALATRRVPRA